MENNRVTRSKSLGSQLSCPRSQLPSLRFGLDASPSSPDVEEKQQTQADGGRGTHCNGLFQGQEGVDGTCKGGEEDRRSEKKGQGA